MPLDPSIILGVRPPAPSPSPIDAEKRLLDLRKARAEEAAQQQAATDQQAISAAYQFALTPEGRFDRAKLLHGIAQSAPQHLAAIAGELDKADTAAATLAKTKADTAKSQTEKAAAELNYLGAIAAGAETPETFGLALAHARESGIDVEPVIQAMARGGVSWKDIRQQVIAASEQQQSLQTSRMNAQTARLNAEKPPAAAAPRNLDEFTALVETKERELGRRLTSGELGDVIKQIAQRPQVAAPLTPQQTKLVEAVLDDPKIWQDLTPSARSEIAAELAAKGFAGFGKPMQESAVKQLAETRSAILSLKDLRATLQENEQFIGPISGLAAVNPYSEARQAQAKIDLVRQRVGKALEGGVLRKEDEEKYKKILATLRDTPATAIFKVDNLITTLERDMDQFVEAQRQAGRNTGAVKTPSRAVQPDETKTVTTDELAAIAKARGTTIEQERQRATAAGYVIR